MGQTVEQKISQIADWIANDCHELKSEIKWLLEQVYIPSNSRIQIDFDKVICPKIEDDYDAILELNNEERETI